MIIVKILVALFYLMIAYDNIKWILKEGILKDRVEIINFQKEHYETLHTDTLGNLTAKESMILARLITITAPLLAGLLGSDLKLLMVAALLSLSSIIVLISDLWLLNGGKVERFAVVEYYKSTLIAIIEIAFTFQMFIVFFF